MAQGGGHTMALPWWAFTRAGGEAEGDGGGLLANMGLNRVGTHLKRPVTILLILVGLLMITINDNICDISVSHPAILSCFLKMDLPTQTPILLLLPFLSFPLPLCVKLAAVVEFFAGFVF